MSTISTIFTKYGNPGAAYQSKFCIMWNIAEDFPWVNNVINTGTGKPLTRIFINKDFKIALAKAFTNLEKAGRHTEIKTFDGCLNERSVRGSNTTSLHAWALAVDLNAGIEKLSQTATNWSGQFVAIMRAAGLYWGGDWQGRKDPMHFGLYNG